MGTRVIPPSWHLRVILSWWTFKIRWGIRVQPLVRGVPINQFIAIYFGSEHPGLIPLFAKVSILGPLDQKEDKQRTKTLSGSLIRIIADAIWSPLKHKESPNFFRSLIGGSTAVSIGTLCACLEAQAIPGSSILIWLVIDFHKFRSVESVPGAQRNCPSPKKASSQIWGANHRPFSSRSREQVPRHVRAMGNSRRL